jgi:transcription initiation factor TFIIIB Brf1 subunit/transcription initiation factor TFIIB
LSIKDDSEANLVELLSRIEEVGDELSLEVNEVTRAGEIATQAWKTNFMHGRTKEATLSAAVYAATREGERTIPPGIIADTIDVEKRKLKHAYQKLKSAQDLDLDPPDPSDYVKYLCETLDLPQDVEHQVDDILSEQTFIGGSPIGTAAASIYSVSSEKSESITLREIAISTKLTKETIWRHTKKL